MVGEGRHRGDLNGKDVATVPPPRRRGLTDPLRRRKNGLEAVLFRGGFEELCDLRIHLHGQVGIHPPFEGPNQGLRERADSAGSGTGEAETAGFHVEEAKLLEHEGNWFDVQPVEFR